MADPTMTRARSRHTWLAWRGQSEGCAPSEYRASCAPEGGCLATEACPEIRRLAQGLFHPVQGGEIPGSVNSIISLGPMAFPTDLDPDHTERDFLRRNRDIKDDAP